mgnify:CR=1 FL=1
MPRVVKERKCEICGHGYLRVYDDGHVERGWDDPDYSPYGGRKWQQHKCVAMRRPSEVFGE